MKIDLTQTYKDKALKNIPHRKRLKEIYWIIEKEGLSQQDALTYADFGCSTGFITNLVAKKLKPKASFGYCHSDMINVGKEKYPHIIFDFFELGEPTNVGPYRFCTCFETLEHVGNIEVALENLCSAAEGGTLLITVPIEVGIRGTVKFLVKTLFYKYNLDELPGNRLYFKYLLSLLTRRDISKFRDKRFGWGTHFGFDYRVIDRILKKKGLKYRSKNKVTTRFYLIYP